MSSVKTNQKGGKNWTNKNVNCQLRFERYHVSSSGNTVRFDTALLVSLFSSFLPSPFCILAFPLPMRVFIYISLSLFHESLPPHADKRASQSASQFVQRTDAILPWKKKHNDIHKNAQETAIIRCETEKSHNLSTKQIR